MSNYTNLKDIEANLQFLKKFEGKKSVITKNGLISSLQANDRNQSSNKYQSPTKQYKKNTNIYTERNEAHQPDESDKFYKLINTEPAVYQYQKKQQYNNPHITRTINCNIKRVQNSSKNSVRSQQPQLSSLNLQNMYRNFYNKNGEQSASSQAKLPKLIISRSQRQLQKHTYDYHMNKQGKNTYSRRSNSQKTTKSTFQMYYEKQFKNDINAHDYFKELQKFQAGLKSLRSDNRSTKKTLPS